MNLKKRILSLCLVLGISILAQGCTNPETKKSSDATSSVSEISDAQSEIEEKPSATVAIITAEPTTQTPMTVPEVTENTTPQVVEPVDIDYIVNTNTGKFHYLSCSSINQMAEHNKMAYNGSRNDLIAQGYEPCKRCNP